MTIVVAGKLVIDEILHLAAPVLPGSRQRAISTTIAGGGQVWHTSRAIRSADVECTVTGWAGADAESTQLREQLRDAGIVDRLVTTGNATKSTVLVGPDGDRAIVSRGGQARLDRDELINTGALDDASWLHIDAYGLDDGTGDAFVELARTARDRGIPISLEPPSLQHRGRTELYIATLPPLAALLGNPDEIAMALDILATPPTYVVTHDGPRMATSRGPGGKTEAQPPSTDIVTNGAGDRFTGGWLAASVQGESDEFRLAAAISAASSSQTMA